jgi:hypothetical protein
LSKTTVELVSRIPSWYITISDPKEQKGVLSVIVPGSSIVTFGFIVTVTVEPYCRTKGEVVEPLLKVSDKLYTLQNL